MEDQFDMWQHKGSDTTSTTLSVIEYEFAIEGMTCVACSSSIERLMHSKYDSQGMKSVAIVLLTHKMTATFDSNEDVERVNPEKICQSVLSIGFGCSLLRISESERSPSSSNNTHDDSNNSNSNSLLN